ncbi:hypothetical protein ACS0TY_010537 [Phlomoides rotata]
MAPSSKVEKKAAGDAAAWMFNVVTSVGIIIVNKALMATYGFSFATTLTGLHFVTATLMTVVLRWLGYIQTSHLPFTELLKFILFANFSILTMILVSFLLEVVFDKIRYSRDTKLSISVVLLGVVVCTVTDMSVYAKGFIAAFIAVWSTALQQYGSILYPFFCVLLFLYNLKETCIILDIHLQYVHFLQRKYSLSSFNLLGHTAPAQAASLLLLGPIMDYWLTNKRIDVFEFTLPSVVLGHMKTILVLILGFLFFGKEGLSIQVVIGMIIAVIGMIWYGNASSKPRGKERRSHSLPRSNQLKHGSSDSSELDNKI